MRKYIDLDRFELAERFFEESLDGRKFQRNPPWYRFRPTKIDCIMMWYECLTEMDAAIKADAASENA